MKKKRLVLAKETVRILAIEPRRVAGGYTWAADGCPGSTGGCPYTAAMTCGQTDPCYNTASRQKCVD